MPKTQKGSPVSVKREYTSDMQEISGFGGGFEATCRKMVLAGCDWFDANPGAEPAFKANQGVYGHLIEDNDQARALSKAMIQVTDGDWGGAMHQAAVSHVFAIQRLGWDQYAAKLTPPAKEA